MTKTILFVCTGNTCRSVLAEYMLRHKLKETNIAGLKVKSCGVAASPLFRVPEFVTEILGKEGVNCANHKSTPADKDLIEDSDLILAMEPHHKQIIVALYPGAAGKTFTLKPYAGLPGDPGIPDPIGQSKLAYEACANEIKKCLELLIKRIEKEEK